MAASALSRSLLSWSAAVLLAGCAGGAPESNPAALSVEPSALGRTWVDRPLRHAAAKNAAGATTAEYFGGTVTANPKVYVVWWGDPSKINSALTATTGGIADFFTGVLNSSFMDWMNEYDTNVTVGAGSHKGMRRHRPAHRPRQLRRCAHAHQHPVGQRHRCADPDDARRCHRRRHAAAARRQHAVRDLFSAGRDHQLGWLEQLLGLWRLPRGHHRDAAPQRLLSRDAGLRRPVQEHDVGVDA